MIGQTLFNLGLVLVLAGFALTLVAFLLLILTTVKGRGTVRGGGVVMIGPFPILFGTDGGLVRVVLTMSIVLIAFLLIFTMLSADFLMISR